MELCTLCPRNCQVNRERTVGFCNCDSKVRVARAALHFMEEPCISGDAGSGTVFFSGCNLRCVYCQNYKVSHHNFGKDISVKRLGEIFLELQEQGANNINLVTGVMYVPQICQALREVRSKLQIPVVYNCGGYESVETLKLLENYVDIYLTDVKYFDNQLAMKYSGAKDYFEVSMKALKEMIRQKGNPEFFGGSNVDTQGAILKKGVIVRHLVLPGHREDSIRILQYLAKYFDKESYILTLMSQFTPFYKCSEYKEINRRVMTFEYNRVVEQAMMLGLDCGYIQDRSSAKEQYTPDFNLEGVLIERKEN